DPAGTPRQLAAADLVFAPSDTIANVALSLPAELRNRVTRFEITGQRSAGAISLTDDSLQRREIAIIAARDEREGLRLLSPTHYLERALEPNADLIGGSLDDIILANPDVIVLADIVTLAGNEPDALMDWIEDGGLLLRFAGPRLAASDIGRSEEDPLMPVRLRAGGRTVGGAMSWGEPKTLRAFSPESPFYGLAVPEDVTVSSQVMAQPDPTLAERTIATLADGTPLVTRKRIGAGQVVLFHVTANADWSTLPLSGLFVTMLERLSVSTRMSGISAEDLAGTVWTADQVLTAFGEIEDAGTLPGVAGERLAEGAPGPDMPPGLYAGEDRRIALNVAGPETTLSAFAWPSDVPVLG
ncbi:MAG: LytTR family transcriptional regulator, partial [Boseongicola sp.]|nr:LytTR family transcriptional regulator [Boseongicola sp.]